MATKPIKCVVIGPGEEASFRKQLDRLREQIRQRMLCHLAGTETDGGRIRITAAVPEAGADDLIVAILPDSVVVEEESANGHSIERYSVFPLSQAINPGAVKAELEHGVLTVVAPTAHHIPSPGEQSSISSRNK